jgi:hypothetical protein
VTEESALRASDVFVRASLREHVVRAAGLLRDNQHGGVQQRRNRVQALPKDGRDLPQQHSPASSRDRA